MSLERPPRLGLENIRASLELDQGLTLSHSRDYWFVVVVVVVVVSN
jgi:hypothetical protein